MSATKQNLDQRRAGHAWNAITSLAKQSGQNQGPREYDDQAKDYGREARKLPIRIKASGLGQALAFINAKAQDSKPGLKKLLEHLNDWVIKKRGLADANPNKSLLLNVIENNSVFMRAATAETLAYLLWLNRFAEAEDIVGGDENA